MDGASIILTGGRKDSFLVNDLVPIQSIAQLSCLKRMIC